VRRENLRDDAELPLRERTLSPSDFGFHHALRDGQGRLAFVDFEYFGWDDPAKTMADFLLHPAMAMTAAQRREFAAGMIALFDDDPRLAARARILYPWFALKWALILLNEFLPGHLRRRRFAGDDDASREQVLLERLHRAGLMLDHVDAGCRQNPYFAS
jgi:thiamine kinase-like enzyme